MLIMYEDLKKLDINQKINVESLNFDKDDANIITMTKILSNDISQNFKVELPKGCKWNNHFHDCTEKILMYEGTLLNNVDNNKINRLTPLIIPPYVDHSIEALEDSIFYVEFKKP